MKAIATNPVIRKGTIIPSGEAFEIEAFEVERFTSLGYVIVDDKEEADPPKSANINIPPEDESEGIPGDIEGDSEDEPKVLKTSDDSDEPLMGASGNVSSSVTTEKGSK